MTNLKLSIATLFCFPILLGALSTFAFAPYYYFFLAIFCLSGLFAIFLPLSPKKAFIAGFSFGLGFFGLGVYWIFISIHYIGEVPSWGSGIITAFFISILSLFPALTGFLSNKYFVQPKTIRLLLIYPAAFVLSEWLRGWIATGFPWLFIGYSQTNSFLKGYAPLLGVFGISYLSLLSSALLVYACSHFKQKKPLLLSTLSIVGIWLMGGFLSTLSWTHPQGNTLSFALVQGNIAQTIKWSPEHLQLSLEKYQDLTAPLWEKNQIIIWPESAIPIPLQDAKDYINQLDAVAKQNHASLLLGIPIAADDQENGYYNAIVTLGKNNVVYLKRVLVPFGEFTPFSRFFANALTFMDIPMSNSVAGAWRQKPFEIEGTKIVPSICYEIAFPDLIRSNDSTIGALLTVTNDAWFGRSNAQAQHLQMAAMRALEFKRPVIFVSNDGITAIIKPDGKILAQAPPHKTFVLKAKVHPMIGLTPWMRFGSDAILFVLFLLLLIARYICKKEQVQQIKN